MRESQPDKRAEQTRDELLWGSPQLAPTHAGEHDPVSVDGEVVCGACGAVAENGIPHAWPDGDEELEELLG